jgi:membrane peptidoglycan carboxypeptidase
LASAARKLTYQVQPGPSPAIRFPKAGPYDERLGYTRLPDFVAKLHAKGYTVTAQARLAPRLLTLIELGFFPIYREKSQAQLDILGQNDERLFVFQNPQRVYPAYDSIPDLIVKTLLFIENQELMDPRHRYRNPAIEWDRLGKATFDQSRKLVDWDYQAGGGSTLATQIEKFRHSPEGRTVGPREKFRQIVSASYRAYLDGAETLQARRQIVLDYINSVPLAAVPGYGEVNGLPDGLWAWYGVDFETVNRLLQDDSTPGNEEWARAYRQVLSLFLAQRRPDYYLRENPQALTSLSDGYLHLLAQAGIISAPMREAALKIKLELRRTAPPVSEISFPQRKAANAIRVDLLRLLELPGLYDVDRLDLTVKSTLHRQTQEEVSQFLQQLRDATQVRAAGLQGNHLLNGRDPSAIVCSVTLYEAGRNANYLRVQADNFDQPLDINEGVKLELGSTAKLRTLITYLEIVADLHKSYASFSPAQLRQTRVPAADHLSQWALQYLATAKDSSLSAILDAAMNRRYSASPAEAFFTGGGLHTFANFSRQDNGRVLPVREAFHHSVNLVFIRIMRDIVNYYMFQDSAATAQLLQNSHNPNRKAYLARFADYEGRKFVSRFYRKYRGKRADEAMELLLQSVSPTPIRLATIYRSVEPDGDTTAFAAFMQHRLPNVKFSYEQIRQLYASSSPAAYSLADRGVLAHVHPLELWTVAYLRHHPQAGLTEVINAGAEVRQEVYTWLFNTQQKNTQDNRIRTMLEIEAFEEIHRAWQRLGYPFEALVPSYATAIGSSADRPAALAELMGILLNDGVRQPTLRIRQLRFAAGTPYETILQPELKAGEQVLLPEIARLVRQELIGVVEQGTAQRVRSAFQLPDGRTLAVGGKTGTGDNRYEIYRPETQSKSWLQNRTATFVFFIGDHFFGTLTVYVPGAEARHFSFTSALPVQLLKILAPKLMPMLNEG